MEIALSSPTLSLAQESSRLTNVVKEKGADYSLLTKRETDYKLSSLQVFGPKEEPKDRFERFDPAVVIDDSTTLESIKPSLENAIEKAVAFYKETTSLSPFNMEAEKQLSLHERALEYMRGSRSDTRSFVGAVSQMSEMVGAYADEQRTARIDKLYESEEQKHGSHFLGKLAYGKIGVLWNVGASQIIQYAEDFNKHSSRVRDAALRNIV